MAILQRRRLVLGAASALAAVQGSAWAQAYPAKPLRLVVPQAAGGGSDTIARYVAERLATALGQQIVVDNKPGAAGMLGAEIVKTAPADGYTMLLGAIDTITAPLVSRRKPFDGVADFAAITQLTASHNVLVVGPSFTGKTLYPDGHHGRTQRARGRAPHLPQRDLLGGPEAHPPPTHGRE